MIYPIFFSILLLHSASLNTCTCIQGSLTFTDISMLCYFCVAELGANGLQITECRHRKLVNRGKKWHICETTTTTISIRTRSKSLPCPFGQFHTPCTSVTWRCRSFTHDMIIFDIIYDSHLLLSPKTNFIGRRFFSALHFDSECQWELKNE